MIPFKELIARQLIGKQIRFKCNCLMPINGIGQIVNFEMSGQEIIFHVNMNNKIIKIGENHPNLLVEYI